jgi:hypothetical protein
MTMNMNVRSRLIRMLRICSRLFFVLTVALTGSFCLTRLFGASADHLGFPQAKG